MKNAATTQATTTIMQIGMMDASNGNPFAPEMYTINHFNMVAYAEGFLFIQPDNESAQRFILSGVDNFPHADSWINEPGYDEAQPCIQ